MALSIEEKKALTYKTRQEIADELGITPQAVAGLERRGLRKVRQAFHNAGADKGTLSRGARSQPGTG